MPYSYQLTVPIIPYRTARYWGSLTFTHDSRVRAVMSPHPQLPVRSRAPAAAHGTRQVDRGGSSSDRRSTSPGHVLFKCSVRYMYYVEPSPALMRILFALPTDRSTAVKKRASASMACVHSCPPNRPRASACTSSGAPSPTATPRELTPGDAETPGSLYASPQGSAYSTTGSVSRSLTPSSAPFLAKRIVAQLTFPASKRLS